MKKAHEVLQLPVEEFEVPPTVPRVEVCYDTYQVASIYCPKKYDEVFMPGTEPKTPCPQHTTRNLQLGPTKAKKTPKREYQF
tara:strand:+ start:400 stop:645 length:246 start_codon:yes stop_codon:yes gene_type:complete